MITGRLSFEDRELVYQSWGDPARKPAIVMLHEGLGSVALWRDFPERLASAMGRYVVAYSRLGYGRSSPLRQARTPEYMHEEARVWLPRVLDALDVAECVLFGHSDGGSIALIHAADRPARVKSLVVLAPHVKVEDVSVRSITAARDAYEGGNLRDRLSRWHADVDSAFRGWNDIWLDPRFRDWNIEALVEHIDVPVLAIQGRDDEYGTLDQVESIHRRHADTQLLILDRCAHSPHRDQPDAVLTETQRFLIATDSAATGSTRPRTAYGP